MRRGTAFFPVILWAMVFSCEQNPGEYDYHGAQPDLGAIDAPGQTELPDVTTNDSGIDQTQAEAVEQLDVAPDVTEDLGKDAVPTANARKCTVLLSFSPPDGSQVFLAGSMTDWDKGEIALEDSEDDGTWEIELDLSGYEPGSYAYKFHTAADNWYMDPSNPMSMWDAGIENSKLRVPDCSLPELKLLSLDVGEGEVKAVVEARNPESSSGVIPATATLLVNGEKQAKSFFDPEKGVFDIALSGQESKGRVTLQLSISNENGECVPLVIPVWVDGKDWEWRDAVIYFAFTDRFFNARKDNDAASACTDPDAPTNWHGGDFAGILKKVQEGYFDDLGVNVLWISPVIDNPSGCYGGQVEGISYTSYHGYFPLDIDSTEEHFGSMDELKDLVDAAHARGIRVIIDFVANHVHEDSNLYKQNKDLGWFHSFYPCEPAWDKPIECWFQPYLPDLDYTNDAVVETFTENALFWIRQTGVDGFRVDAVKHMVHNFTRTLRWKIDQSLVTDHAPFFFFMVGETFMGEWGGGTGQAETVIKEYVNDWELNGQFDFPFYWQVLRAVGRDEGDFAELAGFLEESLGYYGKGALMVSFIGNHDVPRFLSHAAGQIADQWGNGSKLQAFTAPPALPSDAEPFERLKLGLGLILTLPEIPMLYYGDEVGLPGAGDPDNRRDMLFDGLSPNQGSLLEFARLAGKLRRDLAPLRRGDFAVLSSSADTLVFVRTMGSDFVVVGANRSAAGKNVQVAVPLDSAKLVDEVSGAKADVSGGKALLSLPPFGMGVFAPEP